MGRVRNVLQLPKVPRQLNATFKALIHAKGSACAAVLCAA